MAAAAATSVFYNPATGVYTSPRPPIAVPSDPAVSMPSFLFRNLTAHADRPALVDADDPALSLTFRQLCDAVASLAALLAARHGIKHGDVVLILSPNSVLFPLAFLSVVSLGAVATTVNPQYTLREMSHQAKDSGAALVLAGPGLAGPARALGLPVLLLTEFIDVIRSPPPPPPGFRFPDVNQADTAALLYSSGTTGVSKGVVLTHRNFISAALMVTTDQEGEEPSTCLCFLPMFHVFGLSVVNFAQLQRGNTVVVMEKFDMGRMLAAIERHRVSHMFVVPPVMLGLAKLGKVTKYDLSSLSWILSGAAPLAGDLMEEVAKIYPDVDLVQGYGLTETSSVISFENHKLAARRFGSTGYLMSGVEAKVISVDTSKPVPPNHKGELLFRGPNIMKGYFNNPQATKLTIDEEGWLHTGDLGHFDEEGQLYVTDRIKELIKFKGFQIAPAELEGILASHPGILDAAVVPKEDAEAGQVPVAFVVPRNNSLTEADVQNFVASQVAPFKRLRAVIFESSIPKTASGKILRRELTQKVKTLGRDLTDKARSRM